MSSDHCPHPRLTGLRLAITAVALALGTFMVLYWLMGPILAGLVAFLVFGGLAGGLVWYAIQRLKRDL